MMSTEQNLAVSPKRLGIVAANHTGYIDVMFTCMENGNIAVPLRRVDDNDRINIAKVEQVIVPEIGESWFARSLNLPKDDAVTLISFTSGTEGNPKGVILTHNNLTEVVTRLNAVMRIDHSISEYVGVPVYHSFGFGRCRAVASVAGRCFIPPNGFNPSEIGEMLKKGEINAISAVPSLWRVLLTNKDLIGIYGKRVRWIEIGSQYMSRQEKEELKILFPNAIIVQHYGLTEASRTTLLEVHQEEGEQLESVGRALNGIEVKITQDEHIAIRGKHVAEGCITDGQEKSIKDEQGWFITEDLGVLENGYLYYKGRADDIINCGGIKVHPDILESKVYDRIGCDHGLAICRKTDPVRGEGFLVAVTKDLDIDKQQLRETVLQTIQELGVNAANAITITEIETLPKTSSGKVQRKKLSEWYRTQHKEETKPIDFSANTPIQKCFCQTLNLHQVQPQDTFISLGGDSLSYVELSIKLERCLKHLPQNWEKISVGELEQLESQQKLQPQRPHFAAMESSVLLRAIAITGVVINHVGLIPDALIRGGAMLLFLIAGFNLARFQGENLLQGRILQPITSLLWNLLLPYIVIALAYQVYTRNLELPVLLLYGNLLPPGSISPIFPAWFIQVLVQSIVLFSLLFNIRSVRNLGNFCPWRLGLILLCVAIYLRLLVPYLWDTHYLYNRVPHMMIWMLIFGWTIYFAQTQVSIKRIATTLVLCIIILAITGNTFILTGSWPSSSGWILVGGMLILWQPYIYVPRWFKTLLQTVSAAAYHIYLTHMIFIHIIKSGMGVTNPFVKAIGALIGGILTWLTLQAVQQWFFERKRSNY